jgi:DNA mismatch repair protein MutS2
MPKQTKNSASAKALRVLEFDKIRTMLAERTRSGLAEKEANSLEPSFDEFEISERLAETAEAVSVIAVKGSPPIGEYGDIKASVTHAEKGGVLSMAELLLIARHLNVVRMLLAFLGTNNKETPLLANMLSVMSVNKNLEEQVRNSILSESEMADSASSTLRSIRRKIAQATDSIRVHLNKMITSPAYEDALRDRLITIRNDRYVVPVKQEHRQKIAGVVHDQSKGGSTIFIEPQAVVDLNNKLRELDLAEAEEIERILAEFSAQVARDADKIILNQEMLVKLDLVFAKGKLAYDLDAVMPELNDDGNFVIEGGRHPLIDKDTVVPVSLSMEDGLQALIVTGPNTGGKTVTLKTAGLFILMTSAGLFVPADKAIIPRIKKVFADIGDEQSIEQSLSTFSSHMKNIVGITEQADRYSFVFLDELGAGTDPAEGAALAIAILDTLIEKSCHVMASTHYTELKKYALDRSAAGNASMEFDVETLRPTYKLRMGMAGRSNAFEISKRLGLDSEIIAKAQAAIDDDSLAFESVIESVESELEDAEADRRAAADARREAEETLLRVNAKLRDADERAAKIIEKAKAAADDKLQDAASYADLVKDELKALVSRAEEESSLSRGDLLRRLDDNRKLIKSARAEILLDGVDGQGQGRRSRDWILGQAQDDVGESGTFPEGVCPHSASDVKVGDRVRLSALDQKGDVISISAETGDVTVQVGHVKMTVPIGSIELIPGSGKGAPVKKEKISSSKSSSIKRGKLMNVPTRIELIGKNLDEAEQLLDKYLDDSVLAGLFEVTVVHGRGEGILKRGLNEFMKRHRQVKSTRAGSFDEGGEAVTIVTLK